MHSKDQSQHPPAPNNESTNNQWIKHNRLIALEQTEAKPTTYYVVYMRLIFALDYAVDKHKHCLARMYVS